MPINHCSLPYVKFKKDTLNSRKSQITYKRYLLTHYVYYIFIKHKAIVFSIKDLYHIRQSDKRILRNAKFDVYPR